MSEKPQKQKTKYSLVSIWFISSLADFFLFFTFYSVIIRCLIEQPAVISNDLR